MEPIDAAFHFLLHVQKVMAHIYMEGYYIECVKTSWTDGISQIITRGCKSVLLSELKPD